MKQVIRKLLSLLLCLCLLVCLVQVVFADGGDFGGDNDFGGGWDDGGWDNDDWDWDSDSGDYTRSSGSSDLSLTEIIVVVVIVLIYLGFQALRSKRKTQRRVNTAPVRSTVPSLRPMPEYQSIDPAFDAEALKQKLSNFYIQFQQCWQGKNIESLRPFFTDPYYAQLDRQLERYRTGKMTNYIDRPTVLGIELDGFTQGGGNDHVYATVRTRIVDYRVSDETGKVLSGSRTAEKFMTYRYHLVRPTGVTSDKMSGTRALSCPHCGAPLNINQSAKCPYCDSVITVEKHDFVIAQIEAISQVTA